MGLRQVEYSDSPLVFLVMYPVERQFGSKKSVQTTSKYWHKWSNAISVNLLGHTKADSELCGHVWLMSDVIHQYVNNGNQIQRRGGGAHKLRGPPSVHPVVQMYFYHIRKSCMTCALHLKLM